MAKRTVGIPYRFTHRQTFNDKPPHIVATRNIRFNPSEKLNLRLSYSTGFRSPQAYDEDLHIAIVGGERVVTVLAPGLKQESSNSLSASADFYQRFGNIQANFMIEAFYTDLRDVLHCANYNCRMQPETQCSNVTTAEGPPWAD